MWGKINAEKLKSEMSTNREAQQQQSVDNEKTKIIDRHVKLDSGFLSGDHLSLSTDEILPVVDDQFIENDVFNETTNVDPGCLNKKLVPNDCLNEPFEFDITDTNTNTHEQPTNDRNFYFQQNEDGDTHLHLAIIHEYVQVAKKLISICPNPKLLDIRNDDGQSALHLAVLTNQCEIVKSLMMADANAELLDFNGNTAVHLACYGGKLDCLRIIANYAYLPKMLDTINYDGLACIHIATIQNHPSILKFVLHCSKNVNITDYKSGYTALHFAIALDRDNLIESLLEKVDPDIESYAGKFASEVKDDYDYEDEDDDEISDDLVKSIDVLRFPSDSSIKC